MKRPNILVFMTDQQRGDSIFPYNKAITPNLDRFCKEGITFSQAHTIAPHCCPSRATFFSGLYPSQHGVWNNVNVGNTLSRGLYDGVKLFSEDLCEAGYRTSFSGKWHVSDVETPLDRGFVDMEFMTTHKPSHFAHAKPNPYEWECYINYKRKTVREDAEILRSGYPTYTHYGERENPFRDGTVVDDAIRIIKTREQSDEPWFQFVGTLGPHDPYFVPEEYLELYDVDDIELPPTFHDRMKDKPALYRRTRDRFNQLTEQEHKEAIRHYLAFCSYEDALFGRVLETLEASGDMDNTLIIYLSDHGDYMGDHGLWCKGLPCFKSAYHIPCAMKWPAGIKNPGRLVEDFITLADFAPTFLDVCGVEVDRTFVGKSLVPYMQDREPDEVQDAVFTQSNGNELYGIQRSVMTKEWKYVYNGFDYDELYDLTNDPNEMSNIIEDKRYAPIVKMLSKKVWQFARDTDDVCINPYIMVALAEHGPGIIYEDE